MFLMFLQRLGAFEFSLYFTVYLYSLHRRQPEQKCVFINPNILDLQYYIILDLDYINQSL